MPKTVVRFRAFLAILLILQVLSILPDLLTRPAHGVGQLFGALFWVAVATLTLRGSETARKVIVFLTCMGAGAAILGGLGTLAILFDTGSPLVIIATAICALSFFLCLGVISAATDEGFKRWVTYKAYERQNTKHAAIA